MALGEFWDELDVSGELILCTIKLRQSKLEPLMGELNAEGKIFAISEN